MSRIYVLTVVQEAGEPLAGPGGEGRVRIHGSGSGSVPKFHGFMFDGAGSWRTPRRTRRRGTRSGGVCSCCTPSPHSAAPPSSLSSPSSYSCWRTTWPAPTWHPGILKGVVSRVHVPPSSPLSPSSSSYWRMTSRAPPWHPGIFLKGVVTRALYGSCLSCCQVPR